ncbi:hypothetical protein N0V82_003069 [Gnomoniopsis sp. IMI 355080]|nr:hypothetical protein N0V82_003069 [Gnomoniopsis sp. IMI 355080]
MAPKILIVLTSHDQLGSSGKPTGWYLPELAHPYDAFIKAGAELTFASPKGGLAPLDPASVEMFKEDASSQAFLKDHKNLWENTKPLSEFASAADSYDAIFYPGGHGPMFDLANDATSQKLIASFAEKGKPVAAVCHGPAAFVNVKLSNGKHLLEGKEVTGFSNTEEDQVQLSALMPFMLEDKLKEVGGKYVKAAEPWGEKTVVDGNVLTGQNPSSAHKIGEDVLKAIGA